MSFFQKLLGGTFESNRDDGDMFFSQENYAEARLSYERALKKGKDINEDELRKIRKKTSQCLVFLSKARLALADDMADLGDIQQARETLEDISEICSDPEIMAAVAERRRKYEAEEAHRLIGDEEVMSDEDLLAIIAGTWTEVQAEEYAALPEAFREALLLSQDGEHARAAGIIKDLCEADDLPVSPRYLFFELGKEFAAAEMTEESLDALERFYEADKEDGDLDIRVSALTTQGSLLNILERFDEAEKKFIMATRAAPESHMPQFNLGIFLRSRSQYDRSIESLEKAAELMGQMHPDFNVVREMGNTYLAMGRKDEAESSYYSVIEHKASQGLHDQFDPLAAVPLAKIYEEKKEPGKAADIFRHLAEGYDTKNHLVYNLEAARLLKESGNDKDLIERYLLRASELSGGSADNEALSVRDEFQAKQAE